MLRSAAAARPASHLRCVLATTRGGSGLGQASFRRRGKPAVEVVEDGFDGWPQLVGDLVLALALAGAASGLGDDDLEDAGERDSAQFAISGATASVSAMAAARALAWRSDISSESRWTVGLMAARKPRVGFHRIAHRAFPRPVGFRDRVTR